jgi:hypothetical protein
MSDGTCEAGSCCNGHPINTDMSHHPTPHAAGMPSETIYIPFSIKRRAVDLYWQLLKTLLSQGGHEVVLDRIEPDQANGWRIHFLCRDPATITLLHEVAIKGCSAVDSLALLVA